MKSNPKSDVYWMQRTLRLATRGLGLSSPNPSVAALLVKNNQCIGQGVHTQCGGDHGEICALKDAHARGHDPRGAAMYISLAPCTTQGRTPACVDALIQAAVSEVHVALEDPHQGDAEERLQAAGISYTSGCCRALAAHIHGGFLRRMHSGLPRITGKWAMTLDGYVACASGHSQWISNKIALGLSRRRRQVYDAILVGSGTMLADDPALLARSMHGRTPRRVILAGSLIPDFSKKRILKALDRAPIICFHADTDAQRQQAAAALGVQLCAYNAEAGIRSVFTRLADMGCNDVLVEGGAKIHQQLLQEKLYDRLEIYLGNRSIAGGYSVAGDHGAERIALGTEWRLEQDPLRLGACICLRYAQKR